MLNSLNQKRNLKYSWIVLTLKLYEFLVIFLVWIAQYTLFYTLSNCPFCRNQSYALNNVTYPPTINKVIVDIRDTLHSKADAFFFFSIE